MSVVDGMKDVEVISIGSLEVDWQARTLTIDDVVFSLDLLATMVRPNPELSYKFERVGNVVRARTLQAEAASEMASLERSLAYNAACDIVTGSCVPVGEQGEDWWDSAGPVEYEEPDFVDAVKYLELRGLLARHETRTTWISPRDESEAAV